MNIKLTTVGGAEITFDVKDDKEAIARIAFYQSLPDKCGKCSSPVLFSHRQPQGFEYFGLVCANAGQKHESNFGQFKDGGGLFFKNDWHDVQYNSATAERDAEIGQYDNPQSKPSDEPIETRIRNIEAAIRAMGGKDAPVIFNGKSVNDLRLEFETLKTQYKRLEGTRAAERK